MTSSHDPQFPHSQAASGPADGPAADAAAADWAAVRSLFEQMAALPEDRRAAALAAAPVAEALRAEVASLLAHADLGATGTAESEDPEDPACAATRFLAPPALLPWPRHQVATDRSGQRLGAWMVEGLLGHGGMGEVWRAHRADGAWDGTAAIKVLRRGMDSQAVLARFAREQRALARLDHPHIARLLDAGRTPDGLPYFVMEAVDGEPIDRACAGLALEQRLALFLQLADAVSHAHRQLLLHRDLKPSNVLVTRAAGSGATGQVKLLDFGIAKALDPLEGDADDGSATLLGERAFTPHFASPEQVRGEPVGTATDIYSLGVLLYVMLTGCRPYGRQAATALEAARCVLDEAPLRPSAAAVADPRDARRLQGDLDKVLLKALDKLPAQRFPSVDAFAADLRDWLAGFPVSARPLGWGPRAARFVGRHRTATAAATLAVAAVLASTVLAWHQARRAEAQRLVAQQRVAQVRQLANQLVFKYHDQIAYLPGATRVREALLTDAAGFLDQLRQDAADDPALAVELAGTYYRISRLQGIDPSINTGRHGAAEANLDQALALAQGYVDQPGVAIQALTDAVNMQVSRAELRQRAGHMDQADAALRQGLAWLDRALARDPRNTWALASAIRLHGVHARILGNQTALAHLGRWREACASADRSRAAAEATLAADPVNVYVSDSLAFTLREQAHCQQLAGRTAQALALVQRQIGLHDQMAARFPDDLDFRWQRILARAHQAELRSALGEHGPALADMAQARQLAREAAAADPGNAAARPREQALALLQARILAAAGQAAPARQAVLALLPSAAAGTADGAAFAERRPRAETLVWAARLWRDADPARAQAWAREAEALMQPPAGAAAAAATGNAARRWWQAQALGEWAAAQAQAGQRDAARATAARALQVWGPAAELPPALLARHEAARRLASPG